MLDSKDSKYIMEVYKIIQILMKKVPEKFYVSFIREGVADNIFQLININDNDLIISKDFSEYEFNDLKIDYLERKTLIKYDKIQDAEDTLNTQKHDFYIKFSDEDEVNDSEVNENSEVIKLFPTMPKLPKFPRLSIFNNIEEKRKTKIESESALMEDREYDNRKIEQKSDNDSSDFIEIELDAEEKEIEEIKGKSKNADNNLDFLDKNVISNENKEIEFSKFNAIGGATTDMDLSKQIPNPNVNERGFALKERDSSTIQNQVQQKFNDPFYFEQKLQTPERLRNKSLFEIGKKDIFIKE